MSEPFNNNVTFFCIDFAGEVFFKILHDNAPSLYAKIAGMSLILILTPIFFNFLGYCEKVSRALKCKIKSSMLLLKNLGFSLNRKYQEYIRPLIPQEVHSSFRRCQTVNYRQLANEMS